MRVYRITSPHWAGKLTASGISGRWNYEGDYVLYASEHRSLACLENLVHRGGNASAGEFYITEILIPDTIAVELIPETASVQISNTHQSQLITREFGHRWYSSGLSCIVKVNSVLIPREYNFVINTRHPNFQEIRTSSVEPFTLDPRLKTQNPQNSMK